MLIARQPEVPVWKSVMGAHFLFAPIDRKALRRARRAALKALGRDEHEAETEASAEEQIEDLGEPCRPTAQHRQPDGSASAADDDATIRDGRFDLADCDAKRRLLWDAWPR